MKLEVIETVRLVFDIPDDQAAEVRTDAEAWFCNLHNPWAEAESAEVTDRSCNIEEDPVIIAADDDGDGI